MDALGISVNNVRDRSYGAGVAPHDPGWVYRTGAVRVSGNNPSGTVRKGCEQRSERGFGRYTEHKIDPKLLLGGPVRLRWKRLRDFSDSL
jgi:hypothetical protein